MVNVQLGRWACANINVARAWPSITQEIKFGSNLFSLVPPDPTQDLFPIAAIQLSEGEAYEDGRQKIARFLSALSWAWDSPFGVFEFCGNGRGPSGYGGFRANSQNFMSFSGGKDNLHGRFPSDALADISPDQAFPLASWREAKCLALYTPRYAFLAYWKILEFAFPQGQKDFCNKTIPLIIQSPKVVDHFALEGIRWLTQVSSSSDFGVYLYERGRNASAHAKGGRYDLSDPDNIVEEDRLKRCVPIVESIARVCLVEYFRVPTQDKMWIK